MATPEGKVKDQVKALLAEYKIYPASKAGAVPTDVQGWYYMPSATQFGVKGIPDFLGHYKGVFWGVETKAPGKKPTGFQALQIGAIDVSGGAVFVVDGVESLEIFKKWITELEPLLDRLRLDAQKVASATGDKQVLCDETCDCGYILPKPEWPHSRECGFTKAMYPSPDTEDTCRNDFWVCCGGEHLDTDERCPVCGDRS